MVDVIVSLLAWLVMPVVIFVTSALAIMLVLYIPFWLYKMALWLFQKDKLPYKEYEKEINEIINNNIFLNIVVWTSAIVVINYWLVLWSKQPLF
tara:strand:+ start:466 stop:747 length:282 start_codon:yes stop_codon:yes gene_type:complete